MRISDRPNLGETDTGTAVVTFERGDQMAVHMCNGLIRGIRGAESSEIFGPGGIINVAPFSKDSESNLKYITWKDREKRIYKAVVKEGDDWAAYRVYLFRHFVNCIREKRTDLSPMCTVEEGRTAVIMSRVIKESVKSGCITYLPIE